MSCWESDSQFVAEDFKPRSVSLQDLNAFYLNQNKRKREQNITECSNVSADGALGLLGGKSPETQEGPGGAAFLGDADGFSHCSSQKGAILSTLFIALNSML